MLAIVGAYYLAAIALVLHSLQRALVAARELRVAVESRPPRVEITLFKSDSARKIESDHPQPEIIEGSVVERLAIADATSVSVDAGRGG